MERTVPGTERSWNIRRGVALGTEHHAKLPTNEQPARMMCCLGARSLVRLSFPLTLATQPTVVLPRPSRNEPSREPTGSIKSGRVNTQRTVRVLVDFRSAWHRCAVKEGEWHAPAASSRNPPGWGWRLVWDCDTAGDVTLGHDRSPLASNDKPWDRRFVVQKFASANPATKLKPGDLGWWHNYGRC